MSRHCWKIVSDASCTLWKASVQRLQVWFSVLRNWPYSSEEFNWAKGSLMFKDEVTGCKISTAMIAHTRIT